MARRLVLVLHSDDSPDDGITRFAAAVGFGTAALWPFRGDRLGQPGPDVAATVVYGGPFEVFAEDRYPFLLDEADWISACMDNDLTVLGICHGAQ